MSGERDARLERHVPSLYDDSDTNICPSTWIGCVCGWNSRGTDKGTYNGHLLAEPDSSNAAPDANTETRPEAQTPSLQTDDDCYATKDAVDQGILPANVKLHVVRRNSSRPQMVRITFDRKSREVHENYLVRSAPKDMEEIASCAHYLASEFSDQREASAAPAKQTPAASVRQLTGDEREGIKILAMNCWDRDWDFDQRAFDKMISRIEDLINGARPPS